MTHMLMSQKAKKQAELGDVHAAAGDARIAEVFRQIVPGGNEGGEDAIDRPAADPGLNAEPAAGDQRPQQRRNVRAQQAKAGAAIDRKRDAVLRAGVRVEDHRNQHDHVSQEDGEHGLPPVHAAVDQAGGQHVGGDAGRHADPQHGDIFHAPAALGARGGGHVVVVEGRAGEIGGEFLDAVVLAAELIAVDAMEAPAGIIQDESALQ